MKNLFVFLSIITITFNSVAQEKKVEIVPDSLFLTSPTQSIAVVKMACGYSVCGVEVQQVSSDYYLPFKLYDFSSEKENWNSIESVYNTIQAKVPSISITSNSSLNHTPNIRMRGDNNTIVVVDGVRYDASILNTLNPNNIESITVAPSAAASNYLINN